MDSSFLPEWTYQIKAATRDLVRQAGGLERAGRIAGRGKSTIDRYCSPDHPDVIPIDAALRLEQETGTACVTAAMAAINGRTVAERATEAAGGDVLAAVARAAKESADVLAAAASAMADGKISPNEARAIEVEAAEAQEVISDLRTTITAAGGQSLRVV